jgi:hypothetical protein
VEKPSSKEDSVASPIFLSLAGEYEELFEKIKDVVLNDQANVQQADSLLPYYSHFLATCPPEILQTKVLQRLTFVLNRARHFIGVVANAVKLISDGGVFKIQKDAMLVWIDGLLSDDLLMTEMDKPARPEVWILVKAFYQMLQEEVKETFISFLVDKFKKTKHSHSAYQRHMLVKLAVELVEEVNPSFIEAVTEHFVMLKE